MRPSSALLAATCLLTSSLLAGSASADITWRGDFETGDLSQWSNTLNKTGISIDDTVVAEGDHSAKITITDDPEHIWANGINRVEFNYSPPDAATSEGQDTYFGWSFMLPQALTDDNHQIGYYESKNTWSQMMSFPVKGTTLSFVTRKPSNKTPWSADVIEVGKWHDIAVHVHWSKDQSKGLVDVWFDGKQVVTGAEAQTLNDDNPHFIQLGMLRNDPITTDETIYIDNARAGDSIEEVLASAPSATPGEGGAAGTGGSASGGSDPSTGGSSSGAGAAASGAATGGPTTPVPPADEGGCSISPAPRTSSWLWFSAGLALAALVLLRRFVDGRSLSGRRPAPSRTRQTRHR